MSSEGADVNGRTFDRMLTFIERVGFPAAVTLFLLFRFETVIRENTATLAALRLTIAACERLR